MKKIFLTNFFFLLFILGLKSQTLISPNNNFEMTFSISNDGEPAYTLNYKNQEVIKLSHLGFEISKYFSGFSFTENNFSSDFL